MDGQNPDVKHPKRSELSASLRRLFQRRRRPIRWLVGPLGVDCLTHAGPSAHGYRAEWAPFRTAEAGDS